MNGYTHFAIVQKAVQFIERDGNGTETQALRGLESVCGFQLHDFFRALLPGLPAEWRSPVIWVLGLESKETDHYQDLAFWINRGSKTYTEYDGMYFNLDC